MSRRTTDLLWFFVAGVMVGILLASDRPTPPKKSAAQPGGENISKLHDSKPIKQQKAVGG